MTWENIPTTKNSNEPMGLAGTVTAKIFVSIIMLFSYIGTLWFYPSHDNFTKYSGIICVILGVIHLATPLKLKFKAILNVVFYSVIVLFLLVQINMKYG